MLWAEFIEHVLSHLQKLGGDKGRNSQHLSRDEPDSLAGYGASVPVEQEANCGSVAGFHDGVEEVQPVLHLVPGPLSVLLANTPVAFCDAFQLLGPAANLRFAPTLLSQTL
jgi:hypothetical protein